MLLHVLLEQMLVLFSGVANVTNKTVWAITCVLSSFVVCHIVSVHWFVVTKITFKVRNHFGSMRFHLMIFKGGICYKRFFAHYTLLCPCVLVFDMSTVGAWCPNLILQILQAFFLTTWGSIWSSVRFVTLTVDTPYVRCAVGAGLGDLWMEIYPFNCSGVSLKGHFGQLEAILMLLPQQPKSNWRKKSR